MIFRIEANTPIFTVDSVTIKGYYMGMDKEFKIKQEESRMAIFKTMITVELQNSSGCVLDSQDFNLMESARAYIVHDLCADDDSLNIGDKICIGEREVEIE